MLVRLSMKASFLFLLPIVAVLGCGGGSSNTSVTHNLDSTRPSAGSYTGDSILHGDTAPIQSAEVRSDGSAVIVVGPYNQTNGSTIRIVGTFADNGIFVGTTQRFGEATRSTSGTHESAGYKFILVVPVQDGQGGKLTVEGVRTEGS